MGRTLLGIIASLSGILLLVGLTFSRATDGAAEFRLVNGGGEPKTLDPQLLTGEPEQRIAFLIFEGLTRRDAKTLRAAPGIAERWDISPDGLRYTFHLRQGARWTDGHAVTASDFVYSWSRLLDPGSGSEYAYILFPIRHAEAFSTYDGHAEALEGPIAKALQGLVAASPAGVDAAAFQKFLTKNAVFDPLRSEADRAVNALLSRRHGHVTVAELGAFSARLSEAARRLRREAANARAHLGVDQGLFAPDPSTFVVELNAATPYFLEIASFQSALPSPRWVVEAHPKDWFLLPHVVSNGPFRIKTWVVNDHIRVEKSESYWGKNEVRLGSIDVLAVESETTALNLYLTGEVDWLPDWYPKDLVDVLKDRPDFYKNPALTVYLYRLNTTKPPFDDRRVREAVNLAIDRSIITEQVLGLGQPVATTIVPPGLADYSPPETGIRFDVERARALLADAGYPGGKGFPEAGILYNTSGQHKKIAEAVADQLRRNLGIQITAYNQEWQAYLDATRSFSYTMSRAGWHGDYADPNTFLDMWTTNGGNNQTGFSSPLYDRLIAAAADVGAFMKDAEPVLTALDDPASINALIAVNRAARTPGDKLAGFAKLRLALLGEAEGLLVRKEFPIVPVYFYVVSGLLRPNVHGFYTSLESPDGTTAPNLQDLHPLRGVWIENAERGR
jgi:oligopeptide transport system substrate-binding protein